MAGTQINHLATVHRVRPHEVISVMGGFRILFPIFEKSLHSNLSSVQKADIWRYLFKILRTFLSVDPQNMLRLFKHKHLVEGLRSCIVRGGGG